MTNKEKVAYIESVIRYFVYKQMSEDDFKKHIMSYLPKRLYKYRPNGGKAYYEDYIRDNLIYLASIKDSTNDKLEGITPAAVERLLSNNKSIKKQYKKTIYSIINKTFPQIKEEQFDIIFDCLMSNEPDIKIIAEQIRYNYKNISFKESISISKRLININYSFIDHLNNSEECKKSVKMMQTANNQIGISCFSEIPNDDLMWAHYANNFSGYCIEYDLSDYQYNKDIFNVLFPVIYERKKDDDWIAALYKSVISNSSNLPDKKEGEIRYVSNINRMLCTKLSKWRAEHEWRIINSVNKKIKGPKIKSVIIGDKMPEADFIIIKKYCEKNHYPIKIVQMNVLTQKLEIKRLNR